MRVFTDRNTRDKIAWTTQDTSRMGTARVEQVKEADTRIVVKEYYEIWKKVACV